jgi:hypothetical protein
VLVQSGGGAEDAGVVTGICAQEHEAGGGYTGETADVTRLVLKGPIK